MLEDPLVMGMRLRGLGLVRIGTGGGRKRGKDQWSVYLLL